MIKFALTIQALCDAEVEFVVVGGLAGSIHGAARISYDIGVCYARNVVNFRRLVAALAPFHPRPRGFPEELPFIWDETTLRNGSLFTLRTDMGDIDLLGEVSGLGTFDDLKGISGEVEAYGRRFLVLRLEPLIQAKRASGRPKDLEGLPELEALLEAQEP